MAAPLDVSATSADSASTDSPITERSGAIPPPDQAGGLATGGPAEERYECIEAIGIGAMGTVYNAIDHRLGRYVALKRLRPMSDDSSEWIERFLREATILAQLSHENIVRIFDIDRDDVGYYIRYGTG